MSVKPIPEGYHSVTPYLITDDPAGAIEFYKKAFGATESMRLCMPDGTVCHAEIRIGNSAIMLGGECPQSGTRSPKTLGGSPISICLYVEDADATTKQAVAAGAHVVRPIQDQFYGDRSGTVADPFGHNWTVATRKENLSAAEMTSRFAALIKKSA